MSMLYMLKIEMDGHFHGSSDVPRPWVAKITGPNAKYGLSRQFVTAMNDWRDARKAWRGNTYGVVATFPLRDGGIYECSRLRGKPSKRHVAREFYEIVGGKRTNIEPLAALAKVSDIALDSAVELVVELDADNQSWVAHVERVGAAARLGYVTVDDMRQQRHYLLRRGEMYDVCEAGESRLVVVDGAKIRRITQRDACAMLAERVA